MNYLTLINQFWTLRREVPFSSGEADLYFYLLNVSNGLHWKNPFQQANLLICATLGVSEKTLIAARNRLKQYGLIDFTPGVKRTPSTYKLLVLENTLEKFQGIREECDSKSDSVFGSESDSVSGGNAPDINKQKPNETKPLSTPASEQASQVSSTALPTGEKQVVPAGMPPAPPDEGPTFAEFWQAYGKKVGRHKSELKWKALTAAERAAALAALPAYVARKPELQFRKDPLSWLNGKHWEDELPAEAAAPRPQPQPQPVGPAQASTPDLNPEVVSQRQAQREAEAAAARQRVRAAALAS